MHGTFHLETPRNFINASIWIFLQDKSTLTSSASSWNSLWSEIFHILKLSVRFVNKAESRHRKHMFRNGMSSSWYPGGLMPMLCLHPGIQADIHSESRASGRDSLVLTKRTDSFKIMKLFRTMSFSEVRKGS